MEDNQLITIENEQKSILEQIQEITIRLDGIESTASIISENMTDKEGSSAVNLLSVVAADATRDLVGLTNKGFELLKENK